MQVGGSGPLDIMDELGAADAVASAFIDPISKELMRDPPPMASARAPNPNPIVYSVPPQPHHNRVHESWIGIRSSIRYSSDFTVRGPRIPAPTPPM